MWVEIFLGVLIVAGWFYLHAILEALCDIEREAKAINSQLAELQRLRDEIASLKTVISGILSRLDSEPDIDWGD